MRSCTVLPWFMLLTMIWLANIAPGQERRPRWEAPPLDRAISIRDGRTDELLTLDALLDALAQADVVFVGESHTDETTHRVELAIYEGLLARRDNRVVLAMEMFERDVQPSLDAYLKGDIDESEFLKQSRPWSNYRTAYRALVERAKQSGAPLLASNFPRPLISRLAAEGPKAIEALPAETRVQVPDALLTHPDSYWRRVDNAIRGHAGMLRESDRLYSTQSLWDNAMGETCAKALDRFPGYSVVHVNGDFHSSYWEGTVHQLQQRKPNARIKTVSVVPVANPAIAELEGKPSADFVVFAEARASDVNEGRWSVYSQRETKYLFHLPEHAHQTPVPLVILLVDDGLSAADGFDLWKDQIGGEVALAVLEPPYKETQPDFSVGGRWYWADSFTSDIGASVDSVEEVWGYLMRHYPIDAEHVVVVGEGAGATVAAAVGLLTDRIDVHALAHQPRQYAKLKDFPLPLPEAWGDDEPPKRSVSVLIDSSDEAWWAPELKSYNEVGVQAEFSLLDPDPWRRDAQFLASLRTALGLAPRATTPASRGFVLLKEDAPRAASGPACKLCGPRSATTWPSPSWTPNRPTIRLSSFPPNCGPRIWRPPAHFRVAPVRSAARPSSSCPTVSTNSRSAIGSRWRTKIHSPSRAAFSVSALPRPLAIAAWLTCWPNCSPRIAKIS